MYIFSQPFLTYSDSGFKLVKQDVNKFSLYNLVPNSKYTVILREKSGNLTRCNLDKFGFIYILHWIKENLWNI